MGNGYSLSDLEKESKKFFKKPLEKLPIPCFFWEFLLYYTTIRKIKLTLFISVKILEQRADRLVKKSFVKESIFLNLCCS